MGLRQRYRKRRDRFTCETVVLNGMPFRVTRQHGKITGIEMWYPPKVSTGAWGHQIWKNDGKPVMFR